MRRCFNKIVLVLGVLQAVPASPCLSQGIISGLVQSSNGTPLPMVVITLNDSIVSVSDGRGRFQMSGVPAGRNDFMFRRIGFRSLSVTLDRLPRDTSIELLVTIEHLPLQLETVSIVANDVNPRLQGVGFYGRREFGFGRFLEEADITKRNPIFASDLVREMPARYRRRICRIFLDGALVDAHGDALNNLDGLVKPWHISGIEVYSGGGANTPTEFNIYQSPPCTGSTIVIWTK